MPDDAIPAYKVGAPLEWIPVTTFLNGWVNYDASLYPAAAYAKDIHGMVHLRGLIRSGTSTLTAFVLPEGYRPLLYRHIVTVGNDAVGTVRVDNATGNVLPTGSTAWFSLDCVYFDTVS